jgi:hypothetical protein
MGDTLHFNATTSGRNPMQSLWKSQSARLPMALCALAVLLVAGCASAPPSPRVDENDLLAAGFKVLVATTDVQKEWVKDRTPGEINPMQRTGKKYFIYPVAAKNQIYVGGPQEFEAYLRLRPDTQLANQGSGMDAYVKQSEAMSKASARDLSNPYLGLSWNDLLW